MFGLADHFDFIDGGDIHIRKVQQLERLVTNGLDADTTVMIDDRAVDIEAAKQNRIRSVGVSRGFGDVEELQEARPDHIIDSPGQLLELFS